LPEVVVARLFIFAFATLGLLLISVSWRCFDPSLSMTAPAAAQAQQQSAISEADQTRDNVSVSRPTWHRGGGLLYGEVTIRNRNPYPVSHVIITCDFFDEWGNPIGTKGVALRRPIPPGRTRFSGIQFSTSVRNTQGGACHTLSADRMEEE
jgi:hypothetical protein